MLLVILYRKLTYEHSVTRDHIYFAALKLLNVRTRDQLSNSNKMFFFTRAGGCCVQSSGGKKESNLDKRGEGGGGGGGCNP